MTLFSRGPLSGRLGNRPVGDRRTLRTSLRRWVRYIIVMDNKTPPPLTDEERAILAARHEEARASAAIEGFHFTHEDDRLFAWIDEQRLSGDERRDLIIRYSTGKLDPLPWDEK